ncbi:SLIT-ROBO Rho GTPase-activating protein 3 [Trichoplax sp. H2]|nr:SLIT-ROBO Rho GTPase-activating protein 3 [Trichoplax sp. H2]|eukprot:RDD43818.1 SLIT-ROBO Rho GTPase-activating protein 3 [Trichoplax sp. H2]
MASNKRETELFEAQIKARLGDSLCYSSHRVFLSCAHKSIDIRQRLTDQAKAIEFRADSEIAVLGDIQEYFKRKNEIEIEYSRMLEKLADKFKSKIAKKDAACVYDVFNKQLSVDKSRCKLRTSHYKKLNALYVGQIGLLGKEIHYISKKCREIQNLSHEEFMRVLQGLLGSMKNYHICQAQSENVQRKLFKKQNKSTLNPGIMRRQSRKKSDRIIHKTMQKCSAAKLKSINARNDYILNLSAANALFRAYFETGIPELLSSLDLGYQKEVSQIFASCNNMEKKMHNCNFKLIESYSEDIDQFRKEDVGKKFLNDNHQIFETFEDLEFIPQGDDEVKEIECNGAEVFNELDSRYLESDRNRRGLKDIVDEAKNSLRQHLESLTSYGLLSSEDKDDVTDSSTLEASSIDLNINPTIIQCFQNRQQSQSAYLKNFKVYCTSKMLLTMTDTEHQILVNFIGVDGVYTPRIHKTASDQSLPKTFGGEVIEYLEATGRAIPLVVESCIKYITVHGLDLQGIFRLSGSSVDINSLKEQFEKGEDPLKDARDAKYVHAAAGVLRCYFRELPTPLFPSSLLEDLIDCLKQESSEKRIVEIRSVISDLPHIVVVVMRLLFNFLRLVSEHEEQNKMTAANLSLVFGPTLMRLTEEKLITYQMQVNNIMEIIIENSEAIFPQEDVRVKTKLVDLASIQHFINRANDERMSFFDENEEYAETFQDEQVTHDRSSLTIPNSRRKRSKILSELDFGEIRHRRASTKSDDGASFTVGSDMQGSSPVSVDSSSAISQISDSFVTSIIAVAKRDHEREGDNELSFKKGDVIHIISRSNNGSSIGVYSGKQGAVKDEDIEFADENYSSSPVGSLDLPNSSSVINKIENSKANHFNSVKLQRSPVLGGQSAHPLESSEEVQSNEERVNGANSNENESTVKDDGNVRSIKNEDGSSDADKQPRRKKKSFFSSSPLFKRQSSRTTLIKETAAAPNPDPVDAAHETSNNVPTTPQSHF